MNFEIDRFSQLPHRLDLEGVDFGSFAERPLAEPALRCLRYMHDVEAHSVCYLRDLLVTRAHRDPAVTTFLTIWNYEEHWHGEALGAVLAAHGEAGNQGRVGAVRARLGLRDQARPLVVQLGSTLWGNVVALEMTWGAVNEWTTQAAYAQLSRRAGHPVLTELLSRVMRQEGRHIDFYMSQASMRLAPSRAAQRLVRTALGMFWAPVGSGLMPSKEVCSLVSYLFGDDEGRAAARRVDRRVASLPGLAGLHIVEQAAAKRANNRQG